MDKIEALNKLKAQLNEAFEKLDLSELGIFTEARYSNNSL